MRNGKQANFSIFAFTATPKPTTIQLFGRLNKHGQREAFHVYSMNEKLFEEGMERLRDESFEIEEYKSRKIKGRINALEDGYFYTSIPYEKGWRLFVDGKETEIKPFEGAMIGVELAKGEHSIVLRYTPFGFGAGVLISIAALIMLIAAIIITGRRQKNGQ